MDAVTGDYHTKHIKSDSHRKMSCWVSFVGDKFHAETGFLCMYKVEGKAKLSMGNEVDHLRGGEEEQEYSNVLRKPSCLYNEYMSIKHFCMASLCPMAPKRCQSFLKDLNQEFEDPDEKAKLVLCSSCQSTSLRIYKETSRKCIAENAGLLREPG